ncbi:alcohol dehydrogenase [Solimonas soli]|uniref:alcohol dehydrogenase n=1 Tax=Solimonas soli TaxID=413479 RepID=UPI000484EAE6|nr:alcohol dehydrogenase [Solimonas soli]
MRAIQIPRAGGAFELVERDMPVPKAGEVRVRVQACGICHSDVFAKEGLFPGIAYPIVPGHEVVGLIDAVGPDVTNWTVGRRVGIGWHGGHCGACPQCRGGDFILCDNGAVPGLTYDGGYADYMVAPVEALAAVPESLSSVEAAPLLCAGITTFNSLVHSGAQPGDRVAILGLGGLGHLGVQFAAKMGYEVIAIARGSDKAAFAKQLGARHYIDATLGNVSETLNHLGGAKVVLSTVVDADAMSATIDGLSKNGTLLVVGASAEPIKVSPFQLIMGRKAIKGWPSGTARDSEATMDFSALSGVRALIERYPLDRAAEAYERMMSGGARFRVVLETGA